MPTAQTTYLGDLRTEAVHLQSGITIITDAPTDNNGKGEAFSPTDLVATALGSCMMTIMGIVARRDEIDLKGSQMEITKGMSAEPPRRAASARRWKRSLATASPSSPRSRRLHPPRASSAPTSTRPPSRVLMKPAAPPACPC